MKNPINIILKSLTVFFLFIILAATFYYLNTLRLIENYHSELGPEVKNITIEKVTYRDLNKNGLLDAYENHQLTVEERVNDLVSRMTVEEKAGMMYLAMCRMTNTGDLLDFPIFFGNFKEVFLSLIFPATSKMLIDLKLNHFGNEDTYSGETTALFYNKIQKIAERTRLGIPVTLACNPKHTLADGLGFDAGTQSFSNWPSPLGFAATRDTALVRSFGLIAREEYKAVGFRLALHPVADLATEPRWMRVYSTFGEDANLAKAMTYAYIKGFQGDTLTSESVACVTKHFSGGGPQKDGEDPHFVYGKDQVYPGDMFNYHLLPFSEGALKANTAQIMPYYGIPQGQTSENVGFNFNKDIITHLLRDSLKFKGVVTTDWAIVEGLGLMEKVGLDVTRAWGVENLTPEERLKKVIDAGCDQIGGEYNSKMLVGLINTGVITEERIDVSVKRLLRDKFTLGLFDNPYVDLEKVSSVLNSEEKKQIAEVAHVKSMVLAKNNEILPLKTKSKIYIEGFINTSIFGNLGILVDSPVESDFIIKKISTPYDVRNKYFFEFLSKAGRLTFNENELNEIKILSKIKPLITVFNLERAAVLTPIDSLSSALLIEFGTNDNIIAEMIFGIHSPTGKLPLEVPRSKKAVEDQLEDVPYDSENPLYKFGHGLTYSK